LIRQIEEGAEKRQTINGELQERKNGDIFVICIFDNEN
jgi:hypothetical protein